VHVVVKGQWTALAGVQFSAGDLWIVAATVSWAAYALLQKQWSSPLGATARLAAICIGGTLVLVPLTAWEMSQANALPLSSYGLLLIVVAAIVPGLGAYWIYGGRKKSSVPAAWRCRFTSVLFMRRWRPGACWANRWAGTTRWVPH
jgi:drug/metabolite transporter (DMT)-like permease